MKQYRLTEEEFAELMEAGKPTPAMYLSGGQEMFRSPQENANDAWKRLAAKHGFRWDSVGPATTGDKHDFIAEPLTTDRESK